MLAALEETNFRIPGQTLCAGTGLCGRPRSPVVSRGRVRDDNKLPHPKHVRLCDPQHKISIMTYNSAFNTDLFDLSFFEKRRKIEKYKNILKILKYIFVFLECFGLCIDVLSVSIRFSVVLCIYEHI